MMDANKHVLRGSFCKLMTSKDTNLDLVEIPHAAWGASEPDIHADGSIPIDKVWVSTSLDNGGFNILMFNKSIGDHTTMFFTHPLDQSWNSLNTGLPKLPVNGSTEKHLACLNTM